MKFQAFHVNPGEKLKKKDVNNNLSNFMSVFPNICYGFDFKFSFFANQTVEKFKSFVTLWVGADKMVAKYR